MPAIIFSHPKIDAPLTVEIGIDQCSWGYNMNSVTYPTYGGEVVQILSVFHDDLQLGGTVATYERIEQIYNWFLKYMSLATQGREGRGSYNTEPVFINYPTRSWTWHAYPESLPGFRYGREVVAPTWQVTFKVHEWDESIAELTLAAARDGLERIPMGIGYQEDNPFSDPMGNPQGTKEKDRVTKDDLEKFYEKSVEKFTKLIPSYMDGDYESLIGDIGSKPSFLKPQVDEDEGTQQQQSGNNN